MSPDNHNEPTEDLLELEEFACLCGIRVRVIRRLIRLDVIHPAAVRPQPRFRADQVELARKMRRLHLELGVSWLSMPLVLDLLQRIDRLEGRLHRR